jgi:hypothetical protein
MLRPSSPLLSRIFCPIRADPQESHTLDCFPARMGQDSWPQGFSRLLLPGEAAGVDLGEEFRRLPVLVRFGVGEGAVSAEISGWARTLPRCTTRTGPGAIIGC